MTMGFCANCGVQLVEGAKFCSSCGTPYGGVQFVPQTGDAIAEVKVPQPEREKSMIELQKMASYFGKKQAIYNEYDELIEEMSKLKKASGFHAAGVFWGIAFVMIGFLFIVAVLLLFLYSFSSGSFDYLAGFIPLISFGILFILGGAIMLVIKVYFEPRKAKERYAEKQNRLIEVIEELVTHYKQYGYCPVGMEYTNPKVSNIIYNIIRQGRADTPKEAINAMIQDTHRSEMELLAAQTAAASRSSAASNGITAAFMVASFFR